MEAKKFSVRFPDLNGEIKSQDEEYCIVEVNGFERKIRLHDYHEIYAIPGLYEHIFCEKLKYNSPKVVTDLLIEHVMQSSTSIRELVVFDVGAGNGIVGEFLMDKGVNSIVGIDIVPEAAEAARRDRPDVYNKYYVEDLCRLSPDTRRKLEARRFNCLITVGALGFSDIPPLAFAQAYDFINDGGWIAFNIKEDFLEESNTTGFSHLIKRMVDNGTLDIKIKRRYCHRLSIDGRNLYYVAVIGKKKASVPISHYVCDS